MPLVTINIIEGETLEKKKALAKDITETIVKNIGCPPQAITIYIIENSVENIAHGGQLLVDNPPPGK